MLAKNIDKNLLLVQIEHLCQTSKLIRFASYSEPDNLAKVVWDGEGGEHHFLGTPEDVYAFVNGVLVGRQIYTNRQRFAYH